MHLLYTFCSKRYLNEVRIYRLGEIAGKHQGFGRKKDENCADLCLRSIVFSFESGRI